MLLVPLEPALTLRLAGVAARVKLGGGLTLSAIVALLVKVPEVPAMVTVDVPVAAVLAAAKVTELLPAVTGPKVAVTPVGRPDAANATVPLKPFNAVMAMLLAPLDPWLMLKVAGVGARVKLGFGRIVSAMVALLVEVPDVPVTVTVDRPAAAVLAAAKVSALLPDVIAPKVAVTPVGRPDAANATVPLNPFVGTTVIVLAPLAPGRTLRLVGDAVRVKLGGTATVKLRVVVLCRLPDVPVMVTVEVPSTAEVVAVRVSVPGLAAVAVVKDAVTPVGRPVAARVTVPVKPLCGAMVMLLAPVAPR